MGDKVGFYIRTCVLNCLEVLEDVFKKDCVFEVDFDKN